jgi:hypothetical protein
MLREWLTTRETLHGYQDLANFIQAHTGEKRPLGRGGKKRNFL